MGCSRQEYWSGLHSLLQGIFLTQRPNPHLLSLLHWQSGSLPLAPRGKPTVATPELHFLLMSLEKTDFSFLRKQEFFSPVPGFPDCIADPVLCTLRQFCLCNNPPDILGQGGAVGREISCFCVWPGPWQEENDLH